MSLSSIFCLVIELLVIVAYQIKYLFRTIKPSHNNCKWSLKFKIGVIADGRISFLYSDYLNSCPIQALRMFASLC